MAKKFAMVPAKTRQSPPIMPVKFPIARGYKEVVALDSWIRRRVRMYYWKQWKQPRTRRRHLIALGIPPGETKLVTRSRKGCWRISENSILHRALHNAWLEKQGVPDFFKQWIVSTGRKPVSSRNRPVRHACAARLARQAGTRPPGGVGPAAD